jgi:anti-sigma factor RsiW
MSDALLTCKQLLDFLDDYVAEDLAPDARREFDRHLALCPPCVAYLEGYRETIRLGRASLEASDAPAPADVPDELVRAILTARRS